MTDFPTDPAAYCVVVNRADGGDGPVTCIEIRLMRGGSLVAVYDGFDPVDVLIQGARQRERAEAGTDKLPSSVALIEEALWDCGLVEDDAGGEVARALDAQAGEPDCSGIEGGVPDGIRPEVQAVLDGIAPLVDDDEDDAEGGVPPIQALRALAGESEPDAAEALNRAADVGDAMLEALCDLVEWAERTGGWEAPCWDRARDAIAKAEGRAHG